MAYFEALDIYCSKMKIFLKNINVNESYDDFSARGFTIYRGNLEKLLTLKSI